MVSGKNGACEITRFDSTLFKTHFACEVKGYNPDDYFDKKTARKYDLFAQFDLIAADQAIADSGIDAENTDFNDVGVMITSGIGGSLCLSLPCISGGLTKTQYEGLCVNICLCVCVHVCVCGLCV